MTKNSQLHNISPDICPVTSQHFFVPEGAPFLELRTTLDSTMPYAAHVHSAFSLGLILRGKTLFTLDGTQSLAEEGDIVLIAPGSVHSCNPVGGPRSYHMLLIDEAWLQECMAEGLTPCPPRIKDATLFRKATAVMDVIRAGQENAVDMLRDLLLELRTQHGRSAAECQTHNPQLPLLPQLPPLPQLPTLRYTEDTSYGGVPTVSTLARAAGMRRESFSRAVRRTTGLPPSRYMHCLRLEKARRMLRQGKSITEAALAAGYTDQSHFHRVFVAFCAVTPGRYRYDMLHPYKK